MTRTRIRGAGAATAASMLKVATADGGARWHRCRQRAGQALTRGTPPDAPRMSARLVCRIAARESKRASMGTESGARSGLALEGQRRCGRGGRLHRAIMAAGAWLHIRAEDSGQKQQMLVHRHARCHSLTGDKIIVRMVKHTEGKAGQ